MQISKHADGRLETISNWLVAATIVIVPFHAFLTVWAATLVGHFTLLRLWDEVVLGLVVVCAGLLLARDRRLRLQFLQNRLVRVIGLYIVLTVALGIVSLLKHEVVPKALVYAWIVNLRLVIWLVAVWIIAARSRWLLYHWRYLVFVPLILVVGFGLLQFFVLPHNFLKHFGYNDSTSYVAAVTLNQDSSTLRVQSFLRGSNPLGAYLAACLPIVLVCLSRARKSWRYWLLAVLAAITLFLTFSRSAWLGTLLAAVLLGWHAFRRYRRYYIAAIVAVVLVGVIAIGALHKSGGIQDALLHVNNHSTASITSNQGHENALKDSLRDLSSQPLGDGPGTAGQASIYNTGHGPRNTESFLLQIALELGWPGIIIFLTILGLLGYELWLRRMYRLGLGLLIGLAGLIIVNFFSYGWTDDTVAYVWWGLAGIALGSLRPVEDLYEV